MRFLRYLLTYIYPHNKARGHRDGKSEHFGQIKRVANCELRVAELKLKYTQNHCHGTKEIYNRENMVTKSMAKENIFPTFIAKKKKKKEKETGKNFSRAFAAS